MKLFEVESAVHHKGWKFFTSGKIVLVMIQCKLVQPRHNPGQFFFFVQRRRSKPNTNFSTVDLYHQQKVVTIIFDNVFSFFVSLQIILIILKKNIKKWILHLERRLVTTMNKQCVSTRFCTWPFLTFYLITVANYLKFVVTRWQRNSFF